MLPSRPAVHLRRRGSSVDIHFRAPEKIEVRASIREIVLRDYQGFSLASKLPAIARDRPKPGSGRAPVSAL